MNESTALAPMVAFKRELETIAAELPTSNVIPIEKMKSAIIVAVQKNPKLLAADRSSLWQSARMCAADGLVPDGREAAFVLFNTKIGNAWVNAVQYIPMVFGLRKRAMNSGDIKDLDSYLVYEGEWNNGRFKLRAGDDPGIEHDPIIDGAPGEPARGAIIGAYAIATFRNGDKVRHWMSVAEIEKRRRAAPSQRVYSDVKGEKPKVSDVPLGVWADWMEEQYLKTAVRGLSKKLPLSSDDMRAIIESDRDFEPAAITREQISKPTMADRLLAAQGKTVEVDPVTGEADTWTDQEQTDLDESTAHEFDETLGFPGDEVWTEGEGAFTVGDPETSNPYQSNPAYSCWLAGYRAAAKAAE